MNTGSVPAGNLEKENKNNGQPELAQKQTRRAIRTILIAAGLLLLTLLIIGILPRWKRNSELAASTLDRKQSIPVIEATKPHRSQGGGELLLPATTQGIQESVIYARTSGYVRRFLVDLGAQVKTGQLMAEIDVPESNQQLREAQQQQSVADQTVSQANAELLQAQAGLEQAEASLKQAKSNFELARVNLSRSKSLTSQGVVPQQDADDKQAIFDARKADVDVAQANVHSRQAAIKAQQAMIDARLAAAKAQQATVQKFTDVKSFQRVLAPFDGVVTARNLDVGMLVNTSGGLANNQGLFKVSKIDTIRVYINVPQTAAPEIRPGLPVEVEISELPQRIFGGKVATTSKSIDPNSRTLLVVVVIANPRQQIYPGMFAQVKFHLSAPQDLVTIPASALVINAKGTQVVVVKENQTAHFQPIEIGRDLGKEIEIISGLSENDSIVLNPSEAIREGTTVKISTQAK